MNKISVCIITDNNPKVLSAIESVYDLVYEIILVNTVPEFTLDIKGLDKIKLYQFKWCNDFSKARNYSLKQATGDWIFIIDSDEVLQNKSLNFKDEYDFYFATVYDGALPYKSIRAFKNLPNIRYKNKVHESVEDCLKGKTGADSNIKIIHSGCIGLSDSDKLKKIKRNYELMTMDKKAAYRNAFFSKHYYAMGDYQKCIDYGMKALKQKNINNDNKAIICNLLYEAHKAIGYGEAGIDYLRLSIQLLPLQVTARYMIVNYLWNLKEDKYKDVILTELDNIASIIFYKNSELSNEIYLDIKYVIKLINKIKGAKKWRQAINQLL